ncbi:MAG: DNA-directed RNA polymerase subunit omega [Eubacteriales bacterium]|nr:DNA-directed RNA polymerase subunit omega [Eubacteriales bacterium]
MMYPPLEQLLEKVDNKYTLVVEAAKRARQLVGGAPELVKCASDKCVTVAVHEIEDDKIHYERAYDGVK